MIGAGLALTLAGCNSTAIEMPGIGTPAPNAQPAPGGPTVGETLGAGPVRVGMILPLTQNGAPSPVGTSMRNAAQLAIDEFAGPYITLMIQDDHSTPDGAAQAAQAEIGAGAELILGPVFAADVRQAATVAKAANRPMIAFSTDASVASPGVYLLSFLIEGYVERITQFAVSRGKKSFAVMAPQSEYGNIALAQFQQTAGRLNTPVGVIARYAPGQPQSAAQQVAAAGQIDALFIPEQADGMPAVGVGARVERNQDAAAGHRGLERLPRPAAAGASGRLVRRARQRRLQRARAALQGEIRQRADAPGDAVL